MAAVARGAAAGADGARRRCREMGPIHPCEEGAVACRGWAHIELEQGRLAAIHLYLCDVKYCGIVVSLTRLLAGCILVLRSDIKWFYREITRQTKNYTGESAPRCLVRLN